MNLSISHPTGILKGEISYGGSKSISNRVLIIKHLCSQDFEIVNLSKSDDTQKLKNILANIQDVNDVGHAGTTFRFLTSVLALQNNTQILTGSERMKERPIGPLVKALVDLGANIEYTDSIGYPPLKIGVAKREFGDHVDIDGNISSQYISSLLLIAPTLPNGLQINIKGDLVSRPYVLMTLKIMEYFGIRYSWEENSIKITKQDYIGKDFFVESDWSSASYFYSMASLSKSAEISIAGLKSNSLQADATVALISQKMNIETIFKEQLLLKKQADADIKFLEFDFINCPDIAQTVFVMCAGLGVSGLFHGLQTLKIKETDRILASQQELQKIGVFLSKVPTRFAKNANLDYYMQEGKPLIDKPIFETYNDHRMAMAFAPLALLGEIQINDAEVVSKSYPTFWNDLSILGFKIDEVRI